MTLRLWLLLGAALVAALAAGLALGASSLPLSDVSAALMGQGTPEAVLIVRELRLPRVLLASGVGAALGGAGAVLQVTLANPLAEPYLLGVSGGAAVGAVTALALGVSALGALSGFAFAGAMAAVAIILMLARVGGTAPLGRLLMAGVVTGTFANAVIMVLLADAAPTAQRNALWWMMGSVANARWTDVAWLWGIGAVVGGLLLHRARALDVIALGTETAASLGVDPERTVRGAFVMASLLAAATVSTAGLVGFVGLIVPHLARGVIHRGGTRTVITVAALLGSLVVVLADIVARMARAPTELPLGAITAVFGVPFFLWLLRRTR